MVTDCNKIFLRGVDYEQNIFAELTLFYELDIKLYKRIIEIALGSSHAIILVEKKQNTSTEILILGSNDYGELGFDIDSYNKAVKESCCNKEELENKDLFFCLNKPIKHDYFSDKEVVQVCAGDRHSLFLTKTGEVYSCGDNSSGQCSEFEKRTYKPKLISYPFSTKSKVIKIYSGSFHSALVNMDNEVYSWGQTTFDKLGYEVTKSAQKTPRLIPYLKGFYPSLVALFEEQTVIITSDKSNSLVSLIK